MKKEQKIKETQKQALNIPVVMLSCPFCRGEAQEDSEYDSDDNNPDGHQFFVSCKQCGASGEKFYSCTTNEIHLNKKQKIEQKEYIKQSKISAVDSWNKRA